MKSNSQNLLDDFYTDLPQSLKDSIETALKEIEAGEVYDHDWVMQDIKNKFNITL